MTELQTAGFADFFEAVHGFAPFPWQQMLVERVAELGWPEAIDLPTASGKTACLDVAVYTLALQTESPPSARTARRRIFFVVDRRIVVDEAYDRARRLARALEKGQSAIVRQVAERLRRVGGDALPLVASRLRGGTLKDLEWRSSPAQPAIITGTVDQIGSRMLFHSYGASDLTAPIDAALTVCDSLLLLDEAHCAVPFLQTAAAIRRFTSDAWTDVPVAPPLAFTVLSATPPAEVVSVFPGTMAARALDHPVLRERIGASKPAELVLVGRGDGKSADPLVAEAVGRAAAMVESSRMRVAVMVNRVATAAAIEAELRRRYAAGSANTVLLTGRMRPVDRDAIVADWTERLKAGSEIEPDKPVLVVTTQCLEVGADFSFDGLVTECASLDALRQRFGRLNRFGRELLAAAAIIVRSDQVSKDADDPIYGTALREAWNWLTDHASESGRGRGRIRTIDLGIEALEAKLPESPEERRSTVARLSAPAPDSPVLLPAHLDLLAQTAPRPHPVPDPAVFLHGVGRESPEAYIVWRADLEPGKEALWIDILGLLPPISTEALAVPLWRLRRWLSFQPLDPDAGGDVESAPPETVQTDTSAPRAQQPQRVKPSGFVIWKGRERSRVGRSDEIGPGDIVVLPADEDFSSRLGASFQRPMLAGEPASLDAAERAYPRARGRYVLRVTPRVLQRWEEVEPVRRLLQWAREDNPDDAPLPELLAALARHGLEEADGEAAADVPDWLRAAARVLGAPRGLEYVRRHPAEGLLLVGRAVGVVQDDEFAFLDDDDATSEAEGEIGLADHLASVEAVARDFAGRCVHPMVVNAVVIAAAAHDLGKLDERFQALLLGSPLAAAAAAQPVAKSAAMPSTRSQRRALRAASGLPDGFRHEMLSHQLAIRAGAAPGDDAARALVHHLIASHHGHGRPFAPVCHDPDPPDVIGTVARFEVAFDRMARAAEIPAHRVGSGIGESFWGLVRRYGWWGLAYLEAMVRLADWKASHAGTAVASEPALSLQELAT